MMRRPRIKPAALLGLATALAAGCGSGGLGSGGPALTKEQIISCEGSLVDPKTGQADKSPPPPDYGPPPKRR